MEAQAIGPEFPRRDMDLAVDLSYAAAAPVASEVLVQWHAEQAARGGPAAEPGALDKTQARHTQGCSAVIQIAAAIGFNPS